jgi:hypothetical protein
VSPLTMSHIPSLEYRGKPRPILLRIGQVLLGSASVEGFIRAIKWIVDLVGRGETTVDIYNYLPRLLHFLGNPFFFLASLAAGFLILWAQGKNFEGATPKPVLIHGVTKEPLRIKYRIRPTMRLSIWAVVVGLALAVCIEVPFGTPLRRYIFVQLLPELPTRGPLPPAVEPNAPRQTPLNGRASPAPVAASAEPTPVQSQPTKDSTFPSQPPSQATQQPLPQNPPTPAAQPRPSNDQTVSVYQEVNLVWGKVSFLDTGWQGALGEAEKNFNLRAQRNEPAEESQALYQQEIYDYLSPVEPRWNALEPQVQQACRDAVRVMRMPGARQLTPNEWQRELNNCGAAVAAVRNDGFTVQNIVKHNIDAKRFVPLAEYLEGLAKRLGDYPESPAPQQ